MLYGDENLLKKEFTENLLKKAPDYEPQHPALGEIFFLNLVNSTENQLKTCKYNRFSD